MTTVYHVNDAPPGAVYIGRAVSRRRISASPFANQFPVKKYGREGAVARYVLECCTDGYTPQAFAKLARTCLAGQHLACWCKSKKTPNALCHGDFLAEVANAPDLDAAVVAVERWRAWAKGVLAKEAQEATA